MQLFRKELEKMKPYVPGKPIEEVKKEYNIETIEKLASNENPLGPSKKAIERIKAELDYINIYPDATAAKLRQEIALSHDVKMENIVLGNGGEQILTMIAQAFINEGDEAIMADVTFGLYKTSVTHMGGVPVIVKLKDYKHDFEGFINKINDKTKLIYVCNPNNPVGNIMTKDEIDYLVSNINDDIVLVLDEAYYQYAIKNPNYPQSLELLKKRPNTIILRTFSKVAGIAGVRVGYAISNEEICTQMAKVKGVFNINKLAQAAALGALEDKEHIENTVELNYKSMGIMKDYFENNNINYIDSNANFIFVDVNTDSKVLFEELMKKGIIIRPGFLWGMTNWIRVSTGTIDQTNKFVKALDEVLNNK